MAEGLPTELFSTGAQGAFYLPEPENLYQNAAMTIPVTASGDPVGAMMDLSGNGNHATQTVSASRPTYQTDGILHWLQFDGVDDYLVTTQNIGISGADLRSVLTAVTVNTTDSIAVSWGVQTTGKACHQRIVDQALKSQFWAVDLQTADGTVPTSSSNVLSNLFYGNPIGALDSEGVGADARINGVYKPWVSRSGGDVNTTDTELTIGSRSGGSINFTGGSIYGVIVRSGLPNTTDLNNAESYLASLAGITL